MNLKVLARASINERWLMLANLFSEIGLTSVFFVGFAGYAAYGFGGEARIVAMVMFALTFCAMIGAAVGGIIIDRIGPRKTILLAGSVMFTACLFGQFVDGRFTVFLIFASAFGFASAMIRTGYASFAPYLQRNKSGLQKVNSLVTIGSYSAMIVGPAFGALIVSQFPTPRVFLITLLMVPLSMLLMYFRVREEYTPERKAKEERQHPLRELAEGARVIHRSRSLKFYLLAAIAMIFSFGAFDALESVFFKNILQIDIAWLGVMGAIIGVGLVLGSLTLSALPGRFVSASLLLILIAINGIGGVVYYSTHYLLVLGIGNFIMGFALGVFLPMIRTLIQADSPLESAGRVWGTIDMLRIGLLAVPLALSPFISGLIGVQLTLIAAGALTIVLALLLLPFGLRVDARKGDARLIGSVDALAEGETEVRKSKSA
jgi:MFS family permease